jgi:hypothetical protein
MNDAHEKVFEYVHLDGPASPYDDVSVALVETFDPDAVALAVVGGTLGNEAVLQVRGQQNPDQLRWLARTLPKMAADVLVAVDSQS